MGTGRARFNSVHPPTGSYNRTSDANTERHTPSFAMTLPRECDQQDAEKRILNGRWRDHRAFVVIGGIAVGA